MMSWLSDFNVCTSSFKWHSAITEIRKENHESLIMKIVNHASHCYDQSRITLIIWDPFILGDPGAVSKVGRKGGTKVFKYGRKSPWVPTLTEQAISKNSSGCQLLIGHKKYFVLLCSISEQFLLSSFHEFVHDGYCLDHGLSSSCTKEMHAVRKLSVWYKIPIWFQNTVYPKTKDPFPKIQAWAYNRYSRLHLSRLAWILGSF